MKVRRVAVDVAAAHRAVKPQPQHVLQNVGFVAERQRFAKTADGSLCVFEQIAVVSDFVIKDFLFTGFNVGRFVINFLQKSKIGILKGHQQRFEVFRLSAFQQEFGIKDSADFCPQIGTDERILGNTPHRPTPSDYRSESRKPFRRNGKQFPPGGPTPRKAVVRPPADTSLRLL